MLFDTKDIIISSKIKEDLFLTRDSNSNKINKRYEITGEIEIKEGPLSCLEKKINYTVEIVYLLKSEPRIHDFIFNFFDKKIVYKFRTMLPIYIVENNK